jgi:hypothetical protein
VFGFIRDVHSLDIDAPNGIERISANNEFSGLYATAYDVAQRHNDGRLSKVPWQLYLNDLLLMVPSQLLPFEKVEPSEWYMDQIGLRDTGAGFMWSVISQAEVGFGIPELILRGAVLGILFAYLHRWYIRRSDSWIVTGFYVFMCLMSYYTFRATTFFFLVFIEYWFLGSLLFIYVLSMFLPMSAKRRRHPGAIAFGQDDAATAESLRP